MARMGKVDIRGLRKFQGEVEKLSKNADDFAQLCAKELAARGYYAWLSKEHP